MVLKEKVSQIRLPSTSNNEIAWGIFWVLQNWLENDVCLFLSSFDKIFKNQEASL